MKSFLNRLKSILDLTLDAGNRLIDRYEREREFRFYLFAWALFLVILSGSVLTHSNPFRLLVPGLSYSFPRLDPRQEIHYFTFSRRELKLVQLTEKMQQTGRFEDDARRLAYIVRKPIPLVQGKLRSSAPAYFFPAFDLALQRFWLRGDELLIDVDTTFLKQELGRFERAAGSAGDVNVSSRLASMFQVCLTLTLFENYPAIKRIIYLPDGHRIEAGTTRAQDELDLLIKKEGTKKAEKKAEKKGLKKAEEVPPFQFDRVFVR